MPWKYDSLTVQWRSSALVHTPGVVVQFATVLLQLRDLLLCMVYKAA